jgi:hypothetical protein
MRAQFRVFKAGAFTSWDAMCQDVADFMTQVGRDRVIGVSQSEDNGTAVMVVWYWA